MIPPLNETLEYLRLLLSSHNKDQILTEILTGTTATLLSTIIVWSTKAAFHGSTILMKIIAKPKSKIRKIFVKVRTYRNEGLCLMQRRILISRGGLFVYYITEMKRHLNEYRDEIDFGILDIKEKHINLGEEEVSKLIIVFERRHKNNWHYWMATAKSIAIESIRLKFLPCFRRRNTGH
jgi:hypothetical protein